MIDTAKELVEHLIDTYNEQTAETSNTPDREPLVFKTNRTSPDKDEWTYSVMEGDKQIMFGGLSTDPINHKNELAMQLMEWLAEMALSATWVKYNTAGELLDKFKV